jgi:hypothetical protein
MSGDSIGPPRTTRSRDDTEVSDSRVTGQKTNERGWRTVRIDSEFDKGWNRKMAQEFIPMRRTELDGTQSKLFQTAGKADGLNCERKDVWGKEGPRTCFKGFQVVCTYTRLNSGEAGDRQ